MRIDECIVFRAVKQSTSSRSTAGGGLSESITQTSRVPWRTFRLRHTRLFAFLFFVY